MPVEPVEVAASEPHSPPRRERRWRRPLVIVALAFLGVVLTAIIALHVHSHIVLNRAVRAWTAVGGTTDPSTLNPPPVPDEQNAALLWDEAIARLPEPPPQTHSAFARFDEAQQTLLTEPWDAPLEELESLLREVDPALSAAHQAARLPAADWGWKLQDHMDDLGAQNPSIGEMRLLAVMLGAEAALRAREGDRDAAEASLGAALTASEHVGQHPTLLHFLVMVSIDAMVSDRLETMLRHEPAAPSPTADRLLARDYAALARRAMLGEGALMPAVLVRHPQLRYFSIWPLSIWSRYNRAELLRVFAVAVERLSVPFYEATALPAPEGAIPGWTPLAGIMTPALSAQGRTVARAEARQQMLRVALELRDRRDREGVYPEETAFKGPIAALSGQPMEYRRVGNGFALRVEEVDRPWVDPVLWRWDTDELPPEWREAQESAEPDQDVEPSVEPSPD